jgi:hypothetical protein
MCRLSWNLGASTSWNPRSPSRPVMELLCLYLFNSMRSDVHSAVNMTIGGPVHGYHPHLTVWPEDEIASFFLKFCPYLSDDTGSYNKEPPSLFPSRVYWRHSVNISTNEMKANRGVRLNVLDLFFPSRDSISSCGTYLVCSLVLEFMKPLSLNTVFQLGIGRPDV